MSQRVKKSMHVRVNTLDTDHDNILPDKIAVFDPGLCDSKGDPAGDHLALSFSLHLPKPKIVRKLITYRKSKDINISLFECDILNRDLAVWITT